MITRRTFSQALVAGTIFGADHLRLGIGTYTYHNLSIDDMIAQLRALEIKEIEMSRGEFMTFNNPPPEKFVSFRKRIDQAGIRCVSYYAPTIKNANDLDNAVQFAKLLGATNISGDPVGVMLKQVDQRLTSEKMTFGIHNHFFPGKKFDYENPDEILAALEGLSGTVGVTFDVGHIVSCGFDTLDAVGKLGPHLKLVHLKDIKAPGGEINVPLGQGLAKISEVLNELRRIHFQGLIAFEYEKEGDINDDVRRQIEYARTML